jgi:hypothetical protein
MSPSEAECPPNVEEDSSFKYLELLSLFLVIASSLVSVFVDKSTDISFQEQSDNSCSAGLPERIDSPQLMSCVTYLPVKSDTKDFTSVKDEKYGSTALSSCKEQLYKYKMGKII